MTSKAFQLISEGMLEKKFSEFLKYVKRKNISMEFDSLLGLVRAVFEKEIMEFLEIEKDDLVFLLCNINFDLLDESLNWKNAMLMSLSLVDDVEIVLKSWIPSLEKNIELADMILCYGPHGSEDVRNKWIEECKRLAIMTEDESLLETLIYKLGTGIKDDKKLKRVIDKKITESEIVKRAFWSKISRRGH